MKIENERKLLLKKINGKVYEWNDDVVILSQYYLEDGTRFRKFDSFNDGIHYEKVKKTKTGISSSRIEEARRISADEFVEGFRKAISFIRKCRFIKQLDDYKIEVDHFYNIDLNVCEIEIMSDGLISNTIDRLNSIELPDFLKDEIIMEVTEFDEFKNKNLARPFQYEE